MQLPATLRQIGEMAFAGCTHLASIRLPDGLHTIGKECFSESAVLGITLPSTLQEIEEFEGDFLKWFEVIYVKKNSQFYEKCDKRIRGKLAVLSSAKTVVGNVRLERLHTIRNVVLPPGIKIVGEHWFCDTDVETVTFPDSVRKIGREAFCYCR